jgi:hypothetical protein
MAQRQPEEERKAEHGTQGADCKRRQVPAAGPRRAGERQVRAAEQAGQCGPAEGDERGRQLRRLGGATARRVMGTVMAKKATPSRPRARPRDAARRSVMVSLLLPPSVGTVTSTRQYTLADGRNICTGSAADTTKPRPLRIDSVRRAGLVAQRRRPAGRAARAALRRAHPPAPAGAGRAPAFRARMRSTPCGESLHRRRCLRPAAGARPRRGAAAARLLRPVDARPPGRRREARPEAAAMPPATAAEQRHRAHPGHVPAPRARSRCPGSAPCRPTGSTRPCWRPRCGGPPRPGRSRPRPCSTAIPAGEPRLRRALALKLADHGIAAAPEQIVTTLGATHALDVVTRTLLRSGDSVLVDEPGWSSSTRAWPPSACASCRCRAATAGPRSAPCAA